MSSAPALTADEELRLQVAKRAGIASFAGTTIEWYDFYVYSTASALVLGKLFFPAANAGVATLAAFATFWVGFLARPIGGIVFGHFGDRFGRKKALVTTMLMMGIGTTLIGCLPTYATIGAWAPVLLILIRLVQGVAMGGEWGGAVVLAAEHAPKGRGILYGAWAQQGSPAGNLLSTVLWLLIAKLDDHAFYTWGWRIPFLLSALLVVVGLVIRLSIEESPIMKEMMARTEKPERTPIGEILRQHKTAVALGIGASVIAITATYIKGTFALSWAVKSHFFTRSTFLTIVTIALVVQFIVQPFGAWVASKMPLERAVLVLLLPEFVLLPLMFQLIGTGNFGLAALGMALATIPHSMYYAALAGILAKSFPADVRYTGISLSYQLSSTIFAGTAPMLGQWLFNATGSIMAVVAMTLVYVLITLVCGIGLIRYGRQASSSYHSVDSFSTAVEGEHSFTAIDLQDALPTGERPYEYRVDDRA